MRRTARIDQERTGRDTADAAEAASPSADPAEKAVNPGRERPKQYG